MSKMGRPIGSVTKNGKSGRRLGGLYYHPLSEEVKKAVPLAKPPDEHRTAELIPRLLEMVAAGKGLNRVCHELGVGYRTVADWAKQLPDFAADLQAARDRGCDKWAEEILTIADALEGCTDNATVNAARARIDSRKWMLSKMQPHRYGDKVELTGKDGRDLIPANNEARIPRLMQVLMVLLPDADNNELHGLASEMLEKLNGPTNGHDEAEDEEEVPALEYDKRH